MIALGWLGGVLASVSVGEDGWLYLEDCGGSERVGVPAGNGRWAMLPTDRLGVLYRALRGLGAVAYDGRATATDGVPSWCVGMPLWRMEP